MFRRRWFGRNKSGHKPQPAKRARRLAVERLEDRLALSVSIQSLFSSQSQNSAPNSPFIVPGQPGSETTLTFEWTGGDSRFRNEVGVFVVDPSTDRVDGIKPSQAKYARRALSSPSRNVLFAQSENIGASEQLTIQAGQKLAFYLIQNGNASEFLKYNSGNNPKRAPLAFFSAAQANPDRHSHLKAASSGDGVTFRWEDSTFTKKPRHGLAAEITDFNDLIFRMTVGTHDTQPPVITIASPTVGTLASANVTVSGQVTDDRSGVASLRAQLDTGAPFDVPVGSGGAFQFDTALPLTGAADGPHTLTLLAIDVAGNNSLPQPISFTLFTGGLRGPVTELANAHFPDLFMPDPPPGDRAIDNRPNGTGLETSRTRIMVQFKNTATVSDVNAVLHSLGARILGTIADIDLVLIGIPDTGDFSGLDHALTLLNSHPAIALVVQDVALGVSSLPGPTDAQDPGPPVNAWLWNDPTSTINGSALDGNWGLEAVRAPQMWNLNDYGNRSTSHPRTGVLDGGFNDLNGDGMNDHPDGDSAGLRTWKSTDLGLVPGAIADNHGQHVAGIIGAVFDNGVGVDGINPFVERHSVPDEHFIGVSTPMESIADIIDDLDKMLQKWPDLRVVNMSLGYDFPPGGRFPNANDSLHLAAERQGLIVRRLMARHPETFIVAAAGNESNDGWSTEIEAKWTSPWNWAALAGDATDENGVLWHNSPNILVVESVDGVVGNPDSSTFAWQYSKSDFSNVGGSTAAPGGRILSTVGANLVGILPVDPPNYQILGGTSMAAPHVTGLIGYLLTLDSDLSVEQIRTLITDPAFTRTTVLRDHNGFDDDGDGVVDDGNGVVPVFQDDDGDGFADEEEQIMPPTASGPAPMIDAFAAAMGIDLITGDAEKSIQRALVDVDDGTDDGNLRFDPLVQVDVGDAVITTDGLRGDGRITMRDFRAWRDAYIQIQSDKFVSAGLAITLDGAADHAEKDLNLSGVVPGDDHLYPRYDFNGDGSVLDWSATAPFKIDPDTPLPIDPDTGFPAPPPNHSTELERLPGFKRDIDVLADPAFWSELELDGYNEGVNVFPVVEGAESHTFWTDSRYLLANRDPDSPSDFLKDLPDYIHSFDIHVSIDWTALDYGHDAVLLRIDSEQAGPNFAERFSREAIVPADTADFVVTIPVWTGNVQVRVAGFDRDADTLPNLDAVSPRENWSGVKIGEDRALKIEARNYAITNLQALLEPYGVTGSSALAINNLGDVIVDGAIGHTEKTHLFLIDREGVVTDLTPLIPGFYLGVYGLDMNDSREIAGARLSEDGEVEEGFIYRHGQTPSYIDLGVDRVPYDINNAGDVVGEDNGLGRAGARSGFLRRHDGTNVVLGDEATGINNLGHVVGRVDDKAFLWLGGGELIDIGKPPVQAPSIFMGASDINDSGLIAGVYRTGLGTSPFFYQDGNWRTFLAFGSVSSFGTFQVISINESGVAVGNEYAQTVFGQANYSSWRLTLSGAANISNLDPADSPFSKLFPVADINDRGDIVGTGALTHPHSGAHVLKKVL